jgi:8-oxo-dGTP diphosphatase
VVRKQPPGANGRLKIGLAAALRRVPFVVDVVVWFWRLGAPRFTAGVVGVIVNEAGQVLLVEHVFHAEKPWGLPGGWVGRRENPDAALARELMEEIGMPVSIERHLLTASHPTKTHLDFAYLCRPRGGVRHLSHELLSYTWTDPANLPPMYPFHRDAVEAAFPKLVHEGPP